MSDDGMTPSMGNIARSDIAKSSATVTVDRSPDQSALVTEIDDTE